MRDSEQVWFEARRETSDGLFDTYPDGSFDLGKIMITFEESMLFTC
jgi:hypothetical protein